MGFLSTLFGGDAADAAQTAGVLQAQAIDRAIAASKESEKTARADLQPFRDSGASALSSLESLTLDPNAQKDFIQKNPFFDSLATRAKDDLFSNAAARGKVGSGGTAEALQNSLLLLGNDLLSQGINQRFNLASLGSNAAGGQATATLNTGRTIADLNTQQGNAQASGVVGAANARRDALNNLISAGGNAARIYQLSDARAKTEIRRVGQMDNGLPVYSYRHHGSERTEMGVLAQDVLERFPDAVREIEGVLHVDYGAIH